MNSSFFSLIHLNSDRIVPLVESEDQFAPIYVPQVLPLTHRFTSNPAGRFLQDNLHSFLVLIPKPELKPNPIRFHLIVRFKPDDESVNGHSCLFRYRVTNKPMPPAS